ncbi:regulatory protein (GGDEF and EAL domains) [Legionella hackeliae]|nr:EAL domain-containing protein [Legionella hackeliae]STX48839.1 regulatory protein (GGDEF and EAL domains) [Legionella hackeliae]
MLLNHLKIFPIDRIKIDRTYINNIHYNKVDEVIIQAIIAIARSLDLEIVAEGVESSEQIKFLETHECTEGQGYYFCKPLASEEFEVFLRNTMTESF